MDIVAFTRIIRRYALFGQVNDIEKVNFVISDFFCNRLEFDSVFMLVPRLIHESEALAVRFYRLSAQNITDSY